MIYFGEMRNKKVRYGIGFVRNVSFVARGFPFVPHYYLIFRWGSRRWWVAWNRVKRIIRDKEYELDGRKFYMYG